MAELRILHLSDLRERGPREFDPDTRLVMFDRLADFVKDLCSTIDLILISGDLTETGQFDEFSAVDSLLVRLREKLNLETDRMFTVPGNHDLNLKNHEGVAGVVTAQASKAYLDWVNGQERKLPLTLDSKHDYCADIQINSIPISILGFANGWRKFGRDEYRIDQDQVLKLTGKAGEDRSQRLKIALMHVPLKMVGDTSAADTLCRLVDMSLCGHMSEAKPQTGLPFDIRAGWMFAGRRNAENTGCNLITVKWDDKLQNINVEPLSFQLSGKYWITKNRSLHLSRIILRNIQIYRQLDLTFSNLMETNATILLGENSSGKSSLIRSVALGLGKQSETNALLHNYEGDWLQCC